MRQERQSTESTFAKSSAICLSTKSEDTQKKAAVNEWALCSRLSVSHRLLSLYRDSRKSIKIARRSQVISPFSPLFYLLFFAYNCLVSRRTKVENKRFIAIPYLQLHRSKSSEWPSSGGGIDRTMPFYSRKKILIQRKRREERAREKKKEKEKKRRTVKEEENGRRKRRKRVKKVGEKRGKAYL